MQILARSTCARNSVFEHESVDAALSLDPEIAAANMRVIEMMVATCSPEVAPAWRRARAELRRVQVAGPRTTPKPAPKAPATPAAGRARARRTGRGRRGPQRARAARPPGRASDDGDGGDGPPNESGKAPLQISDEHYLRVTRCEGVVAWGMGDDPIDREDP